MRSLNYWGAVVIAGCAVISSPVLACTVTHSVLAFGSINPLTETRRDSTSDITVTCPELTAYSVALSTGTGTYLQRVMTSDLAELKYNLYVDPQRTQVWGDGSGLTVTASGSADALGTTHTVYGSVPADRRARPGVYSDTIVVTVTF